MSECKCRSLREKVLGDGCDICSPVMALEVAYDQKAVRPVKVLGHISPWISYADELEVELSDMRESLQLLHDIMLMGGFDCPELDQAKALLPTPPDTGEKP